MQQRNRSQASPEHSPAPTPSRAVYGFALYLLCYAALLLYLTWALLPESYLQAWGLDFLPQKYWAVAGPTYLAVVFVTFVCLIYPSLGLVAAPTTCQEKVMDYTNRSREVLPGAVPPIYDIPQSEVNSWTRESSRDAKKTK